MRHLWAVINGDANAVSKRVSRHATPGFAAPWDFASSIEGEDTPQHLIAVIRPDVFVKGGDYTRDTLPDHSTTRTISRAVQRATRVRGTVDVAAFATPRNPRHA